MVDRDDGEFLVLPGSPHATVRRQVNADFIQWKKQVMFYFLPINISQFTSSFLSVVDIWWS